MAKVKATFIATKQWGKRFILTKLPASVVAKISYAAVRGVNKEEGAIQRVLNPSRISSVKRFVLSKGDFPNSVVLNWVASDNPLTRAGNNLAFTDKADSAQIIDGQHRVAGLRAAIDEDATVGKLEIPVVIYESLTTQECADIFLAINTEQKPVPRSLVYDLYGVATADHVDTAAVRARDIATYLDEDEASPYQGMIKFPGVKDRRGGIALSTAVTAIKPLVESMGAFELVDIAELEVQRGIILNLFLALEKIHGIAWYDKSNAYLTAAGFMAAMEFLKLKLIAYCNLEKVFTVDAIASALTPSLIITREEIKGLGGSSASNKIYLRLVDAFKPPTTKSKKIRL